MYIGLHRTQSETRNVLVTTAGTFPKAIAEEIAAKITALTGDFDPYWFTVFDTDNTPIALPARTSSAELNNVHLPNECKIEAALMDSDGFKKMKKAGDLPYLTDDEAIEDARSGHGAGGNPRAARAIFAGKRRKYKIRIKRCLREYRNLDRQSAAIEHGEKSQKQNQVLPVVSLFGTGGGTPGAFLDTLIAILEAAAELNIEVKIIPVGICLGSIEPINRNQSYENEFHMLQLLQVLSTNKWIVPDANLLNGRKLFENLIFISNRNNEGEFRSLEQLKQIAALFICHLIVGPLGGMFWQRCIDMADRVKGDFGELDCVSTFGLSVISLDRDRFLHAAAVMAAQQVVKAFQLKVDAKEVMTEAETITNECGIEQGPANNKALNDLLRMPHHGGARADDIAVAFFSEHIRGTKYLKKAQTASRAYEVARTQRIEPFTACAMMNAKEKAAQFKSTIGEMVENALKDIRGITRVKEILSAIKNRVTGYVSDNRRQQNYQQKRLDVSKRKIAVVNNRLAKIGTQGLLGKTVRPFSICKIIRTLVRECPTALPLETECKGRGVLNDYLYPEIMKELNSQFNSIQLKEEKITSVESLLGMDMERLHHLDPVFQAPCGLEIVNRDYLQTKVNEFARVDGGWEPIITTHFNKLLTRYKSLDVLTQMDAAEFRDVLKGYGLEQFQTKVEALDVWTEFNKTCGSESIVKGQIELLIKQSRGLLPTYGEVNKEVPWLKMFLAPSTAAQHELEQLIKDSDQESGSWTGLEWKNPNCIVFFQYRPMISLSTMIQKTKEQTKLRRWYGSDPYIATVPLPGCSEAELATVVAKAILSNQLDYTRSKGYIYSGGKTIKVLKNKHEVYQMISSDYDILGAICGAYISSLFADRATVESKLRELRKPGNDVCCKQLSSLVNDDTWGALSEELERLTPNLDNDSRSSSTVRWIDA